MSAWDTYEKVLAPMLGRGFSFDEIVKNETARFPRFALPPEHAYARMLHPLGMANDLRARMMSKRKIQGLLVHAAYRPRGGAALSQHKFNRALDLDLMPGDARETGMQRDYYVTACETWLDWVASGYKVGIGLYCPKDYRAGYRVHFDVGYRTRHWQHGAAAGTSDVKLIVEGILGRAWPL